MNVMSWLISKVFEVTMKNTTLMIQEDFSPRYDLHMLLAFCRYIQI